MPRANLHSAVGSLSADIERLAQGRHHLIIEGEPGSGKRFCAYLIHMKGVGGRAGNFVEITPEMSDEELKVILFDEDRKRQEGMLGRPIPKLDANSTLFIRRIKQFSLVEQTRIARFLIQNEASAIHERPMIRVIASTIVPWPDVIRNKQVVDSLAQRVTGFERFVVPPLRERKQDIQGIVHAILRDLPKRLGVRGLRLEADVLNRLEQHNWWDNVRELRLVIEEAAVNSTDGKLLLPAQFFDEVEMVRDLQRSIQTGKRSPVDDAVNFLEKTIVQRALRHCGFDYAKTSRLLHLTEQNLRYRIKKHNIYVPAGEK